MRKTLLKMTQDILSSLDGEEINSIGDTTESMQIVGFIRNSYEEMMASLNSPNTGTLFELQPSNDPTQPTVMYLPDTMQNLMWIKYDKSTPDNPNYSYQPVEFIDLETFLIRMYSINQLPQNDVTTFILTLDTGTFNIYCKNNKPPDYYTTIDEHILLFDSYSANLETTLMGNKTSCFGEKVQTFIEDDNWVPNLPPKEFALLENEAKSQAFVEQKQSQNPVAERRAKSGWIRTQRQKVGIPSYANSKLDTDTNYGRRGHTGYARYLRNGR